MTILFLILIIVASAILGFVILVQNPKGGGLSGSIAGFNNQFMGVKQTTDVLEKGTWLFAAIIAILCLISTLFLKGGTNSSTNQDLLKDINPNTNKTAPAPANKPSQPQQTVPLQPSK